MRLREAIVAGRGQRACAFDDRAGRGHQPHGDSLAAELLVQVLVDDQVLIGPRLRRDARVPVPPGARRCRLIASSL